jgi:hypothetical protein
MPTIDANASPAANAAPVVIHLSPADLAVLRKLDDDTAHWDGVFPDAFDGFDDSSPEGGLK